MSVELERRSYGERFKLPLAPFLLALSIGCNERPPPTGGGYVGGSAKGSVKERKEALRPVANLTEGDADETSTSAAPKAPQPANEAPKKYVELTTKWGLSQLEDLGPAGPATATAAGVYFVTRDDRLLLAKRKGKDSFIPLDTAKAELAKYGRGPSISETHAYWVSERGVLLRASLHGGKPEVLFDKARIGTRTSVVTKEGRDVVAFIAEMKDQPYAYVWASKAKGKPETLRITPEGANATSVALVDGSPHPRAVVLSGRLGMSPIHVRTVRTTAKRITLEPDEVIWVGPGSHVLTEIHALTTKGNETVAFLPTAKDFNDFGLAQLNIGPEPGEIEEPDWHIYLNGLDPAPVATGQFCDKNYVLFARPTESRPHSPQELHLVQIRQGAPKEGEVIARSRAFADLSLAPTKTGAIATWTADHRTWGVVLTCPELHSAGPEPQVAP